MTDAPVISDAVVEAACATFYTPERWNGSAWLVSERIKAKERMRAAIQAAVLAEREESAQAFAREAFTHNEPADLVRRYCASIRARSTGGET